MGVVEKEALFMSAFGIFMFLGLFIFRSSIFFVFNYSCVITSYLCLISGWYLEQTSFVSY